jgi:hypothetical protein
MSVPAISILPASDIDANAWDHCIASDPHGLIYSRYHFLHALCDQWHGLVLGQYEAVMPIPWRRKWFIRYAYQPAFIQQLGLTGHYSPDVFPDIQKALRKFVRLGDSTLHHGNAALANSLQHIRPRNNFVLPLHKDFGQIRSGFAPLLLKNMERASRKSLQYLKEYDLEVILTQSRILYGSRIRQRQQKDEAALLQYCIQHPHHCLSRVVRAADGELLASALLVQDERRLYLLINNTTIRGRAMLANHWLMHELIREYSGSNRTLDFEGSMLPGVEQFYRQFGVRTETYYHWELNFFG